MSLHTKDWLKIIGGLAAGATGLGLAGVGPMAALLAGEGAGAGAAAGLGGTAMEGMIGTGTGSTLAGGGAGAGFGSLVGKGAATALGSTGTNMALSGLQGTPTMSSSTPIAVPNIDINTDPWAWFAKMQKGGM